MTLIDARPKQNNNKYNYNNQKKNKTEKWL